MAEARAQAQPGPLASPTTSLTSLKGRLLIVTPPESRKTLPVVSKAQYSPDGKWLVFGVEKESVARGLTAVRLSDFQIFTKPHAGFREFAFGPGQALLVYRAGPKALGLWDLEGRTEELALPSDGHTVEFAFSRDGHLLAVPQKTGDDDGIVTIWDLPKRRLLRTWPEPGQRLELAKFSPDGKFLAVLSDSAVHLVEVSSGRRLGEANLKRAANVAFSADGAVLYSLTEEKLQEWTVPALQPGRATLLPSDEDDKLWPKPMAELQGFSDRLACIQSGDRALLFDPKENKITRVLEGARLSALTPDGRTLWILGKDYRVTSLTLGGQPVEPEDAPWTFSRSLNCPNSDRYSHSPFGTSFEVRSPLTGANVASFQCLDLTPGLKLEWVASTAGNDHAGSPNWKRFAQVAWRGEGSPPSESLPAVQRAFTDPASLLSEVSQPVSYKVRTREDEKTVAALLDAIVEQPGWWNQMCSMPESKPPTSLPLGGYDRPWAPNFISDENFQRVRDVRVQALKVLASRLPDLIPRLTEKSTEATVREPNDRLEIYLMLLLDLNGVEALPQLLEVERALNEYAVYPTRVATPSLNPVRSFGGSYSHHVQVLSVIATILANESAPKVDQLGETETTYDRAHRDLIVGLANDYLKATQPSDFRAAAGMSANVEYR